MTNDINKNHSLKVLKTKLPSSQEQEEIVGLIDFVLGKKDLRTNINDIKTTLTLSLGTKKILDKINVNNQSYDILINSMLRNLENFENMFKNLKNNITHDSKYNFNMKTLSLERKKKVFNYMNYNISFSYNNYISSNNSEDFEFNLKIDSIRYKGKKINLQDFYLKLSRNLNENFNNFNLETNIIYGELIAYFVLLESLIKDVFGLKPNKISLENINEPIYWEFVLSKLKLPKNVILNDIKDKSSEFDIKLMKKKEDYKIGFTN